MAERRFDVVLTGCRPEPLASYLKALGVFRLVAEQVDPDATGCWRGEHFAVCSTLDPGEFVSFFAERWRPTPVVAPWNGGSGFYPKDNTEAGDHILESSDPRLAGFAKSLAVGRHYINERGLTERPADLDKLQMVSSMRARLPDLALAWLDAAVVLGDDRLLFPPLLGTGGNDGRLDFSNNYQQRVVEVLSSRDSSALSSALFGTIETSLFKGAMGQFQPAAGSRTNPWDFVLLIEGAMVFAATATRRFESASRAALAFPFHARAAGGNATLADSDEAESRDELWLPLWSAPATFRSLRRLFAEGRATVGTGDHARPAANALDFARAVTGLGVDRGIDAFSRIGFHVRNGLAYYATPLGRFETREVPQARLLDDIDGWYSHFRSKAVSKNVPARVALACRRLERALFEAAQSGSVSAVLLELGAVDQAIARSLGFAEKAFLKPAPFLPRAWGFASFDGTLEQRLAAALASRKGIRSRITPLTADGRGFSPTNNAYVFSERPLVDNLHALLQRESIESERSETELPWSADVARCSLADIAQFILGRTDDDLIDRWLRALVLLDGGLRPSVPSDPTRPPAAYAVLALVHHRRIGDLLLPRTAGVLTAASAGDARAATTLAIRRLNASGCPLPILSIFEPVQQTRRLAAALAFPLTQAQRHVLASMVLAQPDVTSSSDNTPAQEQA